MVLKLFYFLFLIYFSNTTAEENVCSLKNFRTSGIVPDKLPAVPENVLKVEYNGVPVTCGNLLSRSLTQNHPTVIDYKADKNKLYTLTMIDPDVPTPQNPSAANYRHWLIENIPGNEWRRGDEVSPYYPTAPPSYSDAHRYIFLVYEQLNGPRLNDSMPNEFDKRMHFDHAQFIKDRKFHVPVAGNFFNCHH